MTKHRVFFLLFALSFSGIPIVLNAAQSCLSESQIPSSTPTSRFNDHANGTITDTHSGLMWAKCAEGLSDSGCTTEALVDKFNWEAALVLANTSTLASYSNWRLPNINELRSIVEGRCDSPAINLEVFPNTPDSGFWSASPYAAVVNSAWYVDFGNGGGARHEQFGRSNAHHVRLVRDAQ